MHIYADADALPGAIKEILFRAATRRGLKLTLVANKHLNIPLSEHVALIRVGQGFDMADAAIVELVRPGDLVVTADIPLAAQVVDKGAQALDPRGELHDQDNIKGRLALRNLLSELRDSGTITGGPAPLGPRDREAFANQLDRFLSRRAAQEDEAARDRD